MEYTEQRYESRILELFEKHPTVQKSGFTPGAYKSGLAGIEELDARLGHPWKGYRCIHVAGTNGKGSVSSMCAAALASSGNKVGLYTSPHLLDFRERMKIVSEEGFEMITKEEVWEFLESFPTDGLSFFEITTGMAFWWFARRKVDWAVIEVGLGGRLDSTNIITPELSIITSIGLDHCALLGNTRPGIAAEKAGIFKPGVKAVAGCTDGETEPVFTAAARRTGSPLTFADYVPGFPGEAELLAAMDLRGPCQKANLHTALTALDAIGVAIDGGVTDAVRRTAALTGLRGRWERIGTEPEVICDIAHNPPALKVNFRRLEESGRPLSIVYGIMADKDLDAISSLMPSGARYYLAAPETARALGAAELARRLVALRPDLDLRAFASVAEALSRAVSESVGDTLIYVGGSTFVVSEAVTAINSVK